MSRIPKQRDAESRVTKNRRKFYGLSRYVQQLNYLLTCATSKRLPLAFRYQLKESLAATIPLDYEEAVIHLHADSSLDVKRSNACRKEPETVEWLETQLCQNDVLYDIGANVGAYSLIAAKQKGKNVSVCAFEPSFATYGQLCRNVILNGCQASVMPYVYPLAAKTESSTFHYQSVSAGSALHALGEEVDYSGEAFEPIYSQKVISFSIDDLVKKFGFAVPQLIKLDVDGIELDVLQGARKTLSNSQVRSILVEITRDTTDNKENIVAFLSELGFLTKTQKKDTVVQNYIFGRADRDIT